MSQFRPPFEQEPQQQPQQFQQPHTGYPQWHQPYMQPGHYQKPDEPSPPPLAPYQQLHQSIPQRSAPKSSLRPVGVSAGVITALLALVGVFLRTYHFNTGTSLITQSPISASIGQAVSVGNWQVTVNSVKTNLGDSVNSPKAGDIYIVIDATVVNTTQSNQLLASGYYFRLTDSTGQSYEEQFTDFGEPPDGTLIPNGTLRGQLIYDVPSSDHTFTLQVLGSNDPNAESAVWNITV